MLSATALATRIASLSLTTERLHLRPITPSDNAVQVQHELNPAIMQTIRDPMPQAEIEERVADFSGPWQADEDSWVGLSLVETSTDHVIGFFFLRVISFENQSMEVGYRLHPDYWRQGYALEAGQALLTFLDEVLQVRKAVAYCIKSNAGSAGMLEKLGFVREGCLRQHSPLGGKWHDELVYGLVLAPQRQVP
jgi:ribosomal-protein-alanine N-acetyltransferase